jgi:hypothetical protein
MKRHIASFAKEYSLVKIIHERDILRPFTKETFCDHSLNRYIAIIHQKEYSIIYQNQTRCIIRQRVFFRENHALKRHIAIIHERDILRSFTKVYSVIRKKIFDHLPKSIQPFTKETTSCTHDRVSFWVFTLYVKYTYVICENKPRNSLSDTQELTRALTTLQKDPFLRATLGAKAREHVRARFSHAALGRQVENFKSQIATEFPA